MTDLTKAEWAAIEAAAKAYAESPVDLPRSTLVPLGELRNILRKARRSLDQNALLWALYSDVLKLGGETLGGWSTEDLHTYLCGEYWGWERVKAFGMMRQKPKRRSSRLTKVEFSDYLSFVVRRMAEHGIVLSLPEDL